MSPRCAADLLEAQKMGVPLHKSAVTLKIFAVAPNFALYSYCQDVSI